MTMNLFLTFDLNITLNTFISKIDSYLQENITTKNISPIKKLKIVLDIYQHFLTNI